MYIDNAMISVECSHVHKSSIKDITNSLS